MGNLFGHIFGNNTAINIGLAICVFLLLVIPLLWNKNKLALFLVLLIPSLAAYFLSNHKDELNDKTQAAAAKSIRDLNTTVNSMSEAMRQFSLKYNASSGTVYKDTSFGNTNVELCNTDEIKLTATN